MKTFHRIILAAEREARKYNMQTRADVQAIAAYLLDLILNPVNFTHEADVLLSEPQEDTLPF
jgi:hypothetical protein